MTPPPFTKAEREELRRQHAAAYKQSTFEEEEQASIEWDRACYIGVPRLLADLDAAEAEQQRLYVACEDLVEQRDEAIGAKNALNLAEDELATLRAERDAALLILPACCGSLADAADTMRQELQDAKAKLAALVEAAEIVSEALSSSGYMHHLDAAIEAAKVTT